MDPEDTDTPLSLPVGNCAWSTCDPDTPDCISRFSSSPRSWPAVAVCSARDFPIAGEPAAEGTELGGDKLCRRGEGVALNLPGVSLNGEAGLEESVCRDEDTFD